MGEKKKLNLVPIPPIPAIWQVMRMELIRSVRGKAIKVSAIIAALLVVAATISCLAGDGDSLATFVGTVRRLFPWLSMALSLMFAARIISDDLESGVIFYWTLMPIPRWSVTVGKYFCSAAIVTGIMVSATLLLFIGTHISEPGLIGSHLGDLGKALAAMVGAGLSYTAIFLFLGAAVADLPYLLPLLFVVLFEAGAGSAPVLEIASIRHHVGVVLGSGVQTADNDTVDSVLATLGLVTPDVPIWGSLVVMGVVFLLGLGLGVIVTEFSEYRSGKP